LTSLAAFSVSITDMFLSRALQVLSTRPGRERAAVTPEV